MTSKKLASWVKLDPPNILRMRNANEKQYPSLVLLILVILGLYAPTCLADGNHTWAKSEAWTWMGHLSIIKESSPLELSNEGFAFIHYFTRNDTGLGRMNFKSSAVTKTKDGLGLEYDKKTTFPQLTDKQFQLKVSEVRLDIDFKAPGQQDRIQEVPLTVEDLSFLKEKLLPLYPGLQIRSGWSPKKFTFRAFMGSSYRADLVFFAIWPDIAPPGQKMKFFGQEESYTFSSPMLVAYGSLAKKNSPSRKVVGLCFLDRQWSKDYFGKEIFSDPTSVLKRQQALNWAHNWAAFHAYAPETKDWYFVHLWRQVQRADQKEDRQGDYTGIQWSKNGEQQPMIESQNFHWMPTKFTRNQSKVLLNFAEGRKAYFPYQFNYHHADDGTQLLIEASPKLQSLDQPIYLYEGYARGEGVWDQQQVILQGRLESSQILFRDVDYKRMLQQILRTDSEQLQIASELEKELQGEMSYFDRWKEFRAHRKFLLNNLPRKLQISSSQYRNKPQRTIDHSVIYY